MLLVLLGTFGTSAYSQIATTTPASRCGAGSLVLHATASSGTIKWYTVPFYGTAIATGSSEGTVSSDGTTFTTKSLSVTKTYYVDAVDANGCSKNEGNKRVPVIATISANSIQASIIYESATFCKSVTSGQLPILTGNAGGVYTSVRTSSGTGTLSLNATTGAILPSESAEGEYQVTYTVTAAAGCVENPATTNIVITTAPIAPTISYSGSPFCTSVNTVSVSQSGASGGKYSATPSGLTIDSSNGTITPASSLSGTYTVSYFVAGAGGCAPQTATTTVTMLQLPTASISYSTSAHSYFTKNQGVQSVNLTGTGAYTGGIYSSTSGLTIDATTGAITPSTSTAGEYTVSYTLAAVSPCASPNVATTTVTIYPLPTASIAASTDNVCQHASEPTVTFTGASGRTPYTFTYKVNNGDDQMITTTSGNSVAVAQPTAINGSFEYTLVRVADANGSTQGQTESTTISVNVLPSASFTYSGTPYCNSGSNPTPTLLDGGVSGTFSVAEADAAKLFFVSATTGEIDLARSVAGTYAVTNTVTAPAGCSTVSAIASVTITKLPIAGFSYQAITYCQNAETSPTPTFAEGAVAGTFTSVPAGVRFDHTTPGKIDLANSTPGTYQIVNTIASGGGCADVVATVNNFQIIATPVTPAIAYSGSPYCNTITEAQPVELTGSTGGTFASTRTSSGEGTLSINSETGAITPSTSTPGVYHITYTVGVGDCTTTAVTDVTIYESPVVTNNSTYAICSGGNTNITLTASIPGSFRWTLGEVSSNILDASAGSGESISQVLSNISYTEPGTVEYVIIPTSTADPNLCEGNPFIITVTVSPNPQLVINEPAAVCSPATVDLTAAAVTAGSTASLNLSYWTNYEATTALSNPSAITTSGTYYIKGTTASDCYVVREVSVTVNPLPAAPTSEVVTVTYDGQPHSATATAPSGATVVYYNLETGGEIISAPSATNAGTYTAWAESKADLTPTQCVSETRTLVTLQINVATPTVTPTVGTYTFNGTAQGPDAATNSGTGTSYTFSYVSTDGTTYPASSTKPTNAGSYTVTVTVAANGNYAEGVSSATAFTIIPTTPTGPASTTLCTGSTGVDLKAAVTGTTGTLTVYDAATVGNIVTDETALTTATNYYVSQTISGVESARLTVAVTLNAETTWYYDEDGDTYGDLASPVLACSQPTGYVTNNLDCDDDLATIHPISVAAIGGGASSVCVGATTPAFTNETAGGTWSIVAGTGNATIDGSGIVTGTAAGTVTVEYSNPDWCGSKATASLTVNDLPQGSLTANGPFTCSGAGMLTWTATIGTGPYTIVYNDGTADRTASGVVSGTPFATFTTPVTGTTTYTLVSVQDANCTRSSEFTGGTATITVSPAPTLTTTNGAVTPVCFSSGAQTTTLDYTATTNTPTSYIFELEGYTAQSSTTFSFSPTGGTITGIAIPAGLGNGTYRGWITIKTDNNCTQQQEVSVNVKEFTATPAITTTELCPGTTTVSGTSEGNADIVVYAEGSSIGTTTASEEGVWTATVTALVAGNSITAKATSADKCQSVASDAVTVKSVSATPVVTSPICPGATQVAGQCSDVDGTIITVFARQQGQGEQEEVEVGTAVVTANNWLLEDIDALPEGRLVRAKATATGKCESNFSDLAYVSIASAPVISGIDGSKIATGSCQSNTSTINLYKNGTTLIGTVSVSYFSSTWTSGVLNVASNDVITAKAIIVGMCESVASNEIIIP